MKKFEVELFCTQCLEETVHIATYLGDLLVVVECSKCGKKTQVSKHIPLVELTEELLDRVVSKPFRIVREMRKSPRKTILSLPRRALTKPVRIVKEVFADIKKITGE